MKRLFTFGCSHTQWSHPTWADFLATGYDHFENWGLRGSGNRATIERLSEFLMQNNITSDDTIIVQWTDFHRFDVHNPTKQWRTSWNCLGPILSAEENLNFVKYHWYEGSYIYHTYNFIHFAITMLNNLPCKWIMFSRNDLTRDLDRFQQLRVYKPLFNDPHWISPMRDYLDRTNFQGTPLNLYRVKRSLWGSEGKECFTKIDDHPPPDVHAAWLKECLLPNLDVTIDESFINKVVTRYHEVKSNEMEEDALFNSVDWLDAKWHQFDHTVNGL